MASLTLIFTRSVELRTHSASCRSVSKKPRTWVFNIKCHTTGYKLLNSLKPDDAYASLKWVVIDSGNGLSSAQCHAITWTNDDILSSRPRGTYFSEILFEIQKFSFKKMHLKMSWAECRPLCLGLNVFINWGLKNIYLRDWDQFWRGLLSQCTKVHAKQEV